MMEACINISCNIYVFYNKQLSGKNSCSGKQLCKLSLYLCVCVCMHVLTVKRISFEGPTAAL